MSTSTPRSGPSWTGVAPERASGSRARWATWAGVALLGLLVAGPSVERADAKLAAPPPGSGLSLIASYVLSVSEPSDLALDGSGQSLWTVTDRPGRVHQLSLDGALIRTLKFVGDDLEGIAYDPTDHTLWVAEENLRAVIHLDLQGNVLSRHPLGLSGKKNSGLEGLCLDAKGHMFVLNEKDPGLFLELDSKHDIAVRRKLAFAVDYSAITYDPKYDGFWIVSDQSQKLFQCDRKAAVRREYGLPFPKPEGIAVNEAAKRAYMVSDSEHRLYVFRLED